MKKKLKYIQDKVRRAHIHPIEKIKKEYNTKIKENR